MLPPSHEIQRLHFARDFAGLFTLTYNNSNATGCGDNDGLGYMRGETPQVNLPAHCSGKTEQLGADASPYVVKVALEALGNVEAVDVPRKWFAGGQPLDEYAEWPPSLKPADELTKQAKAKAGELQKATVAAEHGGRD